MKHKIIIYQLFPRLFGNTMSRFKKYGTKEENGTGKFDDISKIALDEIKNLGITHIWLTGIIEHATMTDYSDYGILKDNPQIVKGCAGSPYAIKDYYDVDPDLANHPANRMQEFEALLSRIKKIGLKTIIDFVPNHVARQYHSDSMPKGVQDFGENDDQKKAFDPQNNFYYIPNKKFVPPENNKLSLFYSEKISYYNEKPSKATGNNVFSEKPGQNDWYETIKLNYGVDYQNGGQTHFEPIPDTWKKMKNILMFWAKKGIDGFRCDMAEMVPVEFWSWVIPKIKKSNHNPLFIAEIYQPEKYHSFLYAGFDYLYDKVGLYDTLRSIIENNKSTKAITDCWQSQEGINNKMLRFLENHDEQRIASGHFAGKAEKAFPAMVVSNSMHKGPIMIYNGQEVGVDANGAQGFSGDDGRTSIYDYCSMPVFQKWLNHGKCDGALLSDNQKSIRSFYQKLFTLSHKYEAIYKGDFYDLMWLNKHLKDVFSFIRFTEKQKLLFVVNFADKTQNIKLFIPEHALLHIGIQKNMRFSGRCIFSTKLYFTLISGKCMIERGMKINLKENGFLILELQKHQNSIE